MSWLAPVAVMVIAGCGPSDSQQLPDPSLGPVDHVEMSTWTIDLPRHLGMTAAAPLREEEGAWWSNAHEAPWVNLSLHDPVDVPWDVLLRQVADFVSPRVPAREESVLLPAGKASFVHASGPDGPRAAFVFQTTDGRLGALQTEGVPIEDAMRIAYSIRILR